MVAFLLWVKEKKGGFECVSLHEVAQVGRSEPRRDSQSLLNFVPKFLGGGLMWFCSALFVLNHGIIL